MDLNTERKLYLTVSDEILCELGRIIIFQVQLEYMIASEISNLLEIKQEKCQMITSELSFKQLIALLSSLLLQKLGKENKKYIEYLDIKRELYEFENFRNTIAHSMWAHSSILDDKSKATRIKITSKEKTGLKHTYEEINTHYLIEKLEHAGITLAKFVFLMKEVTN